MAKDKPIRSLYKSEHGRTSGYRRTRSPEADPYWEGCKDARLMLPWCTDCARAHFYPRRFCPHCDSRSIEWREASGEGTVYSFAVVSQPIERQFAERVPYVIAIVELPEGVRLATRLCDDVAPDTVTCGMAVKVQFEQVSEELTIPVFGKL